MRSSTDQIHGNPLIVENRYLHRIRYCALFCSVMSLLRVIPFFAVFGWTSLYKEGPNEVDQLAAAAMGKAMDAVAVYHAVGLVESSLVRLASRRPILDPRRCYTCPFSGRYLLVESLLPLQLRI